MMDSTWQKVWDWLIGEAGAGWILGIAGLMFGLYQWNRQPRPPKVVAQVVRRTSLLDIRVHPLERDNITISYGQGQSVRKIQGLEQQTIALFNIGTGHLDRFRLTFGLQNGHEDNFWKLASADYSYEIIEQAEYSRQEHGIYYYCVELPYINSLSQHRRVVYLYLLSEKPITIVSIEGSGPGWSSEFASLSDVESARRFARIGFRTLMIVSLAAAVVVGQLVLLNWLAQFPLFASLMPGAFGFALVSAVLILLTLVILFVLQSRIYRFLIRTRLRAPLIEEILTPEGP